MVTFRNKGRCGNFLFQAATAFAYALKHNQEFTVPTSTKDLFWNPLYLQHLSNPNFNPQLHSIVIPEGPHCFQDIRYEPMYHGSNVVLDGYWQSYLYFDWCRDKLLDAFQFPTARTAGMVGIHVRRGDYLKYPDINPLATMHYYDQAIEITWSKGYQRYMVYSDDIAWCKKEFTRARYPSCEFFFSAGNGILDDLTNLSWCEHVIMSNSTFAWWGAWLNQNPDKVVMCPHEDNYYGPRNKHLDVSTLYPREWIRLKY